MRIKSLDELKQIDNLHPDFYKHAGKEVTILELRVAEIPGIILPEYVDNQ